MSNKEAIIVLHEKGLSVKQIADATGIMFACVYNVVRHNVMGDCATCDPEVSKNCDSCPIPDDE